MPTERWTKLRYHAIQNALWHSLVRFAVVPAGRRSGKTEIGKRKAIRAGARFYKAPNGRFVCAAPTHSQAKDIFWEDLKLFIPNRMLLFPERPHRSISESKLTIRLWNNATIQVAGLDKPERIEGPPLDGIVISEFGNVKADAWSKHVRPALSTPGREGWAVLEGVPEGRNHYYRTANFAIAEMAKQIQNPSQVRWEESWGYYHWFSADVLSSHEIDAAKRELDEMTFKQEYEASFINFTGQAYHSFDRTKHAVTRFRYDPEGDLVFCFDFNVEPGIAVVIQELPTQGADPRIGFDEYVSVVVGEVWIPRASNTVHVCNKLIADWGSHKGMVFCYGDATGGARGTAKLQGSDWDIIRGMLKPVFGDRLFFRVPSCNPRERVRVNAVNSRLKSLDGIVRMAVDPTKAPHVVEDFEGTIVKEGGAGEIDKEADSQRSHLTDALGYYIARRYPIAGSKVTNELV